MLDNNDVANILRIMNRATYTGLEEAKVATVLSLKLATLNRKLPEQPVGDATNNPE